MASLLPDHLGSASLTTDASGNKIGELRYMPYGATRYVWGSTPTDRRYTGQRSEEGSLGSLYDYGARFMSPVLGRFLSADSVVPDPANPQLFNRYSYAGNSPIVYNDPDGHCGPLCPVIAVAAVVAFALMVSGCSQPQQVATPTDEPVLSPGPIKISTYTPMPTSTSRPTSTSTPQARQRVSPVNGSATVIQGYKNPGGFGNDGHNGVDVISVNDPGSTIDQYADRVGGREVYAMEDGAVTGFYYPDYDPGDPSKLPSGRYGATYEIQHGTDHYQYTHVYPLRNADGTLRYGIGSQIQAGTQIGFYARIGWSDRPHLHVSRLLYNDKTKKWDIPDDPGTIP